MSHDFTRRSFLSAATGASALAFGIGSTGARQGPTYTLAMTPNGWVGQSPTEIDGQNNPTLNPDPGQEVTIEWENRTDIIHNFAITRRYPGGEALQRSDYVAPGESQSVTFTAEEGLGAYYCENHLDEMGEIVVGEGQQTQATTQDVEVERTAQASVPVTTFRFVGSTEGWQGLAPSSIQGETNPTLQMVPGNLYAIHWINGDGAPHNVEIKNDLNQELVRSDITARGGATQTVKFLATEQMTEYYCQYHPLRMSGDIEFVSEEQVTQQPTTAEEQAEFTRHTVSRDISQANETQQTTAPGRTTTAADQMTTEEQTTMAGQTTVPGQTTMANQTTAPGQTTTANQTTTMANQTTVPGQTTMANQTTAADVGSVDVSSIVRQVPAPGFGALTALGGIGGAMSYLLSRGNDEE
ncbi:MULTISPECIES: plastocyanin/azurin family copper-binding protein [Halorussus]|uniref:cupredoxin domain-containing protein n=1 Tax=Halorussus TaxID=1070314 RepID=UPI000E210944|nr:MULTISPECIES: plastocyanin/azurin family copper-binding protein [Halorussus]NHN57732.1 hypothetical protein [Halorussus sp. JP-T4]